MKKFTLNFLLLPFILLVTSKAFGGTFVSNLQASYRNGQTFLTWTCPAGTNFTYKVYRSTTILDKNSKLTTSKNIGYVIDSSSLNVRLTRKSGSKVFFTIKEGDSPLASNVGVYVVSCDYEKSYYYAVTVTDAVKEYKKITLGSNSLSNPISEHIDYPQPILQSTEVMTATGETAYKYALFGNNQNLPNYPAMFSQGSYGFNFNIVYRGNYSGGPLYVFHEGLEGNAFVGNGLDEFSNTTNCIIISNDDWMPYPNGYSSTSGINSYWSGYSEKFNPYITTNTVPTSGTIKMYQQHRYIYEIQWANKFLPIDSNRVNLIGVSAGGFGALLTAIMLPNKIAAVYAVCAPIVIKSFNNDGYELDNQMWGDPGTHLLSDVIDPTTGLGYEIFDLMNIKTMMNKLKDSGLPVIYTIHGKNDNTVFWSDKPTYLSQNENYWQGGVHFWDQRQHDGTNSNFFDSETMPKFDRFAINASFPAFSHCDGNEDPGDGDPLTGDAYGSFSGSVAWDSLTEDACNWKVNTSIIDFTVGGVVSNSDVTSCFAKVTIRKAQKFAPKDGETIKWYNYNSSNTQIQSGSFVYHLGDAISIDSVKIKRAGTRLEIQRKNCTLKEDEEENSYTVTLPLNQMAINNTSDGWVVVINSAVNQMAYLNLFDMMGRSLVSKTVSLNEGANYIELNAPSHGTFLIGLVAENGRQAVKATY